MEQGFWSLVKKTETCWLWTGFRNKDGYGMYKGRLAHRLIFIETYGEYPLGTITDHLCRVRFCVNPSHLEAVTPVVNVRRGLIPKMMRAKHKAVKQCPQGHPYVASNLYLDVNKDGYTRRKCKTCTKERRRLQYLREKEARKAAKT